MALRQMPRWFLVGLAILLLLGHVCVSAEAGDALLAAPGYPSDPHDAASPHDDHPDGTAGESHLHGASCEAVRASQSPTPWVAWHLAPVAVAAPVSLTTAAADVRVPAPTASPPLFLLHAALLI